MLTTLYRKFGFLALVLVPYTLVAAVLHLRLIPGGYGWTVPIRTLRAVIRDEYFATLCLGALLIGATVRLEKGELTRIRAALGQQIERARVIEWSRRTLLIVIPALVIAAIDSEYNAVDYISVVAISAAIGTWKWNREGFVRALLQLIFVVVVYTFVSYSFSVFKALVFHFRIPHDDQIIAVEHAIVRCYPHRIVAEWASTRPWAVILSDSVYFSLFKHMSLVSVFLIATRDHQRRTEYLSALVLAYMLGGLAHYLWPGLGPGYVEPERFKYLARSPLSTNIVRWLLVENTTAVATGKAHGVYTFMYIAAMPSLHVAHEVVCLWFVRSSRIALAISGVFTAITLAAIVILGWHYPIDAVAGTLLAVAAMAIVRRHRNHLFPAGLQPQ